MENYFIIEDKLPSLNEYVAVCRANKYKGAKFKRDTEYLISLYIFSAKNEKTLRETDSPVIVEFEWHEKTKKRDADNIASAKKFVLDALQKMNIIPNDNRKYVKGFADSIIDDTKNYVVVRLIDAT